MEDTQNNDALIEEMIREAEKGVEQSETRAGTVVDRGGDTTPPILVSSVEGGGRVKVYDTKTGDMSYVLYNPDTGGLLRKVLKDRHPDGTQRFSLRPPRDEDGNIITPPKGTLKCWLHPADPNRERYNLMGLPVCRKSNITSPYMVEKHMKGRHPSAFGTIQKERQDAEKKADRDFQRELLEGLAGKGVKENNPQPKKRGRPKKK